MFSLSTKKTGRYQEARSCLDSHIKYLDQIENLYEEGGKLISFNMLSKINLHEPLILNKGVALYLVCKHVGKISGVVHCEPDSFVNPQWHDVDENFFIIKGFISITIENVTKKMNKGDSLTVTKGQIHSTAHSERAIYMVDFIRGY